MIKCSYNYKRRTDLTNTASQMKGGVTPGIYNTIYVCLISSLEHFLARFSMHQESTCKNAAKAMDVTLGCISRHVSDERGKR